MYKMQNSFVNISFFCIYSRRSNILEVLTTQEILPFDDDILNLPTAVSPPVSPPAPGVRVDPGPGLSLLLVTLLTLTITVALTILYVR